MTTIDPSPLPDAQSPAVLEDAWQDRAVDFEVPEPPRKEQGWLAAIVRVLGIIWRGIKRAAEWLFGLVSLILGLAVLAAIPPFHFLAYGYLLEVSGRIARTQKFTKGFIGIRKAARVGSIIIGSFVVLLPLQLTSYMLTDARLIAVGSPAALGWEVAHIMLTMLLVGHVLVACARGGKLRHFFWPFPSPWKIVKAPFRLFRQIVRFDLGGIRGDLASCFRPAITFFKSPLVHMREGYCRSRDAVWDFVVSLRLPYFFWLGLRGFVGTMCWLALPVIMLIAAHDRPVIGFLGAILMGLVVLYLPFLQVRFVQENRLREMFAWRQIRRDFCRAPIAFWFSLSCLLLFALPLYLLKIEYPPREIVWLPGVVFVLFILPARLLLGWAYARSQRREEVRHWFFRWTSRLGMLPVASFYVLILFFSLYVAQHGKQNLFDQHAFLMPFLNF